MAARVGLEVVGRKCGLEGGALEKPSQAATALVSLKGITVHTTSCFLSFHHLHTHTHVFPPFFPLTPAWV